MIVSIENDEEPIQITYIDGKLSEILPGTRPYGFSSYIKTITAWLKVMQDDELAVYILDAE